MLRTSNNVFRFTSPIPTRPLFRASSVEALPASFRNYLHVAATARAARITTPHSVSQWSRSPAWTQNSVIFSRAFHATRRNETWPLLLAGLKSTLVFNILQSVIRVALTLVPMALLRKHMGSKFLRKLDQHPNKYPEWEAKRPNIMRKIRINSIILRTLIFVPMSMYALVVFASLERTPLTGRLRLIVLSPEEEEGVARDLAGSGWYQAVNELLTEYRSPPKYIPPSDWRYMWVERTLRRLESVVPALQNDSQLRQAWLDRDENDPPYPPPPDYPLIPRPRASQRLHYLESLNADSESRQKRAANDVPPHSVLGPPYSLLVVDQPDHPNAFSYGFGPNGGGGVVVFSGFLEEILGKIGPAIPEDTQTKSSSLFSLLTRSLFSSPRLSPPVPTPEQDAQLASLMAHELAHLLLSHQLETLSSATVFLPSLMSIVTDLFRAILFPITMVGGPFLNDALEQVGEIGKREFATVADSCSSQGLEIEADVVSIRLMALAGWDPRAAVEFWESKVKAPLTPELRQQAVQTQLPGVLPGALWVSQEGGVHSASHPVNELRVKKMKEELERWRVERRRALQTFQ